MTLARKIISGVVRVNERFGVSHVTSVLRGENLAKIRELGHNTLSTYGLLKEHSKEEIQDWIYQLISQNLLAQEGSPYPILKLTANSKAVLKSEMTVSLTKLPEQIKTKSEKSNLDSWDGVDQNLFETLRLYRKNIASSKSVPPFQIFSDVTLRELSRIRPSNLQKLNLIYGIGEQKLKEFGSDILTIIHKHCEENQILMDISVSPKPTTEKKLPAVSEVRALAFELFKENKSIEEVMEKTGRAKMTVLDYFAHYLEQEKPEDITSYISVEKYETIQKAAAQVGLERLKPIYLALEEKYSYDEIRIGQVVDTNSAWLGQKLSEAGIRVKKILSISDDLQEINSSLQQSIGEADLIITTGGLGPTKDDITKKAIAAFVGSELYFHKPTYERIKRIFEKLGRPMSPATRSKM